MFFVFVFICIYLKVLIICISKETLIFLLHNNKFIYLFIFCLPNPLHPHVYLKSLDGYSFLVHNFMELSSVFQDSMRFAANFCYTTL